MSTWNFIIKDFPSYRLDFLKKLSAQHNFNLLLLSNTNELHIEYVKETVPFYDDFKTQFDQFYLSHEIHFRKPDTDIFEFLLSDNNLSAQECLFIDDTEENIITAKTLGFHTWHLDPVNEDVVTLFESCKRVFNYE
ncbi:MAG: hypothetical protein EX263_13355 [Flavobacteriaceae bacterium]|nr:MAG: hypothetical protein EX263_13355 [Flavobacteriaceae bacterium]